MKTMFVCTDGFSTQCDTESNDAIFIIFYNQNNALSVIIIIIVERRLNEFPMM